jgi:4-hydroxy-3-polyprenylbenzoate decarboxylase
LVLAVREAPLHGGHLRMLTMLSDMGSIIAPIVPAFYNRPKTLDDIVNHTCGRLLDLFGIDAGVVKRWRDQGPFGARVLKPHPTSKSESTACEAMPTD